MTAQAYDFSVTPNLDGLHSKGCWPQHRASVPAISWSSPRLLRTRHPLMWSAHEVSQL